MQVVYHLGAPCTDVDLLIRSLLKNRTRLARDGIVVPAPGRYREIIIETSRALRGQPATLEVQDALLDNIAGEAEVERLVLSDPRFICINRLVVQRAQIWPMIGRQTTQLRAVFPAAEVEFFIGLRDPATLIPALFRASRFTDFSEFTENMEPASVAWSDTLRRLREEHPDCPIIVWCNEDTPLIWGDVMRAMAGVGASYALDGVDDLAETIMAPQGYNRMQAYFAGTPPATEVQRRRIVSAFLERYARPGALEETFDLPGWTQSAMSEMSAAYEEDMATVATMPGVVFLRP